MSIHVFRVSTGEISTILETSSSLELVFAVPFTVTVVTVVTVQVYTSGERIVKRWRP